MLFEHITSQIHDKFKFINVQQEEVKNMHKALNKLYEYQDILKVTSEFVHGKAGML
jgi:hypothetical protein